VHWSYYYYYYYYYMYSLCQVLGNLDVWDRGSLPDRIIEQEQSTGGTSPSQNQVEGNASAIASAMAVVKSCADSQDGGESVLSRYRRGAV
jgi:hypothetical protein